MTRDQQSTGKDLEAAFAKWLQSFGWVPDGKRWRHPRLNASCLFTTHDAYMQTRADPRLGWP